LRPLSLTPLRSNFLKLCKVKYYNFCCFYNVQKDYIAQTGDQTATGKDGQSIYGYPVFFSPA